MKNYFIKLKTLIVNKFSKRFLTWYSHSAQLLFSFSTESLKHRNRRALEEILLLIIMSFSFVDVSSKKDRWKIFPQSYLTPTLQIDSDSLILDWILKIFFELASGRMNSR